MRPNVSRIRSTFRNDPGRSSKANFVYLRPDPGSSILTLGVFTWRITLYAAVAAIIWLIAWQCPVTPPSFKYFYLPIAFFSVGPFIARRLEAPPVVMVVCACVYVFFVAHGLKRPYDSSSNPSFELIVLATFLPAISAAVVRLSYFESPFVSGAGIALLFSAMLVGLAEGDARAMTRLVWIPFVTAIALAAIVVRTRAGRLSASPKTPATAAYRFADLNRYWFETRRSGAPFFRWRWLVAIACSALAVRNSYTCLTALARAIASAEGQAPLQVATPASLDFLITAYLLPVALASILCRVSPIASLLRTPFIVLTALADWHEDQHPTPHGPGIRSAASMDLSGFPLRAFTLFGIVILSTTVVGTILPAPQPLCMDGLCDFRSLASLTAIFALRPLVALSLILSVLSATCGPWFAYFRHIINVATAAEESTS